MFFKFTVFHAQSCWDDLGIFPSHLEITPLHHIPDITLPTFHQMRGFSWYRGLADPPPHPSLPPNPLCEPPPWRTNPSFHPDRLAPPMLIYFVDGIGYTVNREPLVLLTSRLLGNGWRNSGAAGGGGGRGK